MMQNTWAALVFHLEPRHRSWNKIQEKFLQFNSKVYFPKRALNSYSNVKMMGGGGPYKSLDP